MLNALPAAQSTASKLLRKQEAPTPSRTITHWPHLILSWSISWFTRRTFALFVPVLLTSLATDDKTYHKCWIPYWHANEIIQQCLSEQLNLFWNLQQYLHVKFRTLIQIACACTSQQNTIQWQNFKDRHLMVEILPICHGNTLHF